MEIIRSDEHIIVVNKPAGLSVLPDGWENNSSHLVKLLEEQFGKIYIVHRLDKVTSGVMIFARSADSHRILNKQFEKRDVEKIYHAIVEGNPKWDERVAKFSLRANVGKKHRTMVDDRNGKPSETRFKIIMRYPTATWIEAKPMTGRTHQVRVHAYALGHPLIGDILYSASQTDLITRPALHAKSLTFTHPATNERILIDTNYPLDFANALKGLGN